MGKFLRFELQTFGNLVRRGEGRRQLLIYLLILPYVWFLSSGVATSLIDQEDFSKLAHSSQGSALLHILLGISFAPILVVVFLNSMKASKKILFHGEGPQLLLTAPIPRTRILMLAWGHLVLLNLPWALAIAFPFVGVLFQSSRAPLSAYGIVPVAVLVLTLPVVALTITWHVLFLRWVASPRLQKAFGLLSGFLVLVALTLLFLGVFDPGHFVREASRRMMEALSKGTYTLPFFLEAPAFLLGRAAGLETASRGLVFVLLLLIGSPLPLILVARFYARAYENNQQVSNPASSSAARGERRDKRARWPAGPAASMYRKDFLHAWKAPGGLIGQFVMVALIVFFSFNEGLENLRDPAAFASRVGIPGVLHAVPPQPLRHAAFLLLLLAFLLVMVMPGITAAILNGERRQWALLAGSPASRKALLRGKLAWVFTLLGFYTLVVTATGLFLRHLDPRGVLGFLAVAPPVLFAGVLVPLAVQTHPWLASARSEAQPPIGRNMVGSFLSVGALFLMMLPGFLYWGQAERVYAGKGGFLSALGPRWAGPLGLVLLWAFGLLAGGIGLRFALAHFRKLTGPADD